MATKTLKAKLKDIDEKLGILHKEKAELEHIQAQMLVHLMRDVDAHKLDFELVLGACHETLKDIPEDRRADLIQAGQKLLRIYEKRLCA